jgi:hypothetical protein
MMNDLVERMNHARSMKRGPGRPKKIQDSPPEPGPAIEVPGTVDAAPVETPQVDKENEPENYYGRIRVGEPNGRVPSLATPEADPFAPFKVDTEHYHYRALNVRSHNIRVRKAEGYEIVPNAPEFGDLVLGRLRKDVHEARANIKSTKIKNQRSAAVDTFRAEADRHGVKTFEEK